MNDLRNTTLVFLIKRTNGSISEICLAMKKRGFGANRWNGVGGKIEGNETLEEAAKREAKEEIGVDLGVLEKVAELEFHFPHQPAWDQLVHTYFCEQWDGEPSESEEMSPAWFVPSDIPFDAMWSDDPIWLPHVLRGDRVRATFTFGEGDVVLSHNLELVEEKF